MIYKQLMKKTCEVVGSANSLLLFAFYGSIMYKTLDDVRDIDAFAVFKGKEIKTGRMDIFFDHCGVRKKASIYIVSEIDFYRDIHKGDFGGRWPVIIYHGAKLEEEFEEYYLKLYCDSIHSLTRHLGLNLYAEAEDFFRENNIRVCAAFPFYINSVRDFCTFPELRKQNYQLYDRCLDTIKSNLLHVKKREDLTYKYLETDLVFRGRDIENIRSFQEKLETSIKRLEENKNVIADFYGEQAVHMLQSSVESIREMVCHVCISNINMFKYYGMFQI